MRFSVTGLIALSVALTACQQTKLSSPTTPPARQNPTATNSPQQQPTPPNPPRNPPPPVNYHPPPPPQPTGTFTPQLPPPPPQNSFTNNPAPPTWNNPPHPQPVPPTIPFVNNPQQPPPGNQPPSNQPTFTPVPVQPEQPVITSTPPLQPPDHPTNNPTVVTPPFMNPPVVNTPPPVVHNPPPQPPQTPPVAQTPPPQVAPPVVHPNFQPPPTPQSTTPWYELQPPAITAQPNNLGPQGPRQEIVPPQPLPAENCFRNPNCRPPQHQTVTVPIGNQSPIAPPPGRPPVAAPAPRPATVTSGGVRRNNTPAPTVTATPPPKATPAPECEAIPLNGEAKKSKVDILFLLDASASLRGGPNHKTGGKLGQLAREMRFFVPQLNPTTDYRIGIIPGHGAATGDRAGNNYHGKLLPIRGTNDFVVDSQKVKVACKNDPKCVGDRIATVLENTMKNLPKDHSGADGEVLLLSLYDSIMSKPLRDKIISQGFYRKDAKLAIIIISDEQDGCFDFEGSAYTPNHKDKDGNLTAGMDKTEIYTLEHFCKKAIHGRPFLPNDAADAVKTLKGDDYITSGVIYQDNANVPRNNGSRLPEGVGYGFIQFLELTKGSAADLGLVTNLQTDRMEFSAQSQFAFLGKVTNDRLNFNIPFKCKSNVSPYAVNTTTLQVQIRDVRTQQQIALFSGNCALGANCADGIAGGTQATIEMGPQGDHPFLNVMVDENVLAEIMKVRGSQATEAKITFNLRSDVATDADRPTPGRH